MATTQLSLYKDAITLVGGRRIASLTEERKSRRVLDDAWDEGRLVEGCLEHRVVARQEEFRCCVHRLHLVHLTKDLLNGRYEKRKKRGWPVKATLVSVTSHMQEAQEDPQDHAIQQRGC